MRDERKKAGVWPWITALLIGLPVLYVASFGPACWLAGWNLGLNFKCVEVLYRPILRLSTVDALRDDCTIHSAIHKYATLCTPTDCISVELIFVRAYLELPGGSQYGGCFP
jgi:hypothetical protein